MVRNEIPSGSAVSEFAAGDVGKGRFDGLPVRIERRIGNEAYFQSIEGRGGRGPQENGEWDCKERSDSARSVDSTGIDKSGGSKTQTEKAEELNRRTRRVGTAMEVPQPV